MRSIRVAVAVVAAAGLGVCAYWSVRLSAADWLGRRHSPESVRQASLLAPGDAGLRARLGDWAEAVSLNPYDSASRIRLGLAAEERGDLVDAERSLLEAARLDRLFEPRWTLANFYLRRRQWEPFWQWAREAARLSPEPPMALYRLCFEAAPNVEEIYRRVVSGRPRLTEGYLRWVRWQSDAPGLRAVVAQVAGAAGSGEREAVNGGLRRLIELGMPAEALAAWNRMIGRGLLPFEPLLPEAGRSLTNGAFRLPPEGGVFDWSLPKVEGVESRWQAGAGLRFEFRGAQPEACDLLDQRLPVLPGRRYRLHSRYRTTGIVSGAGPRWRVGDFAASAPLGSAEWKEAVIEFSVPAGVDFARLRLAYERVPGTTRIEGVLRIEKVALDLLGR